jgi:hypothetical protein
LEGLVRQSSTPFLGLIGKALRINYSEAAREPLPERWVDLINHLNELEKAKQTRNPKNECASEPRRQVQ